MKNRVCLTLLATALAMTVPTSEAEDSLAKDTGINRSGVIEPQVGPRTPVEQLGRIDESTLDQVARRWQSLRSKTSRWVPPLAVADAVVDGALKSRYPASEVAIDRAPDDFTLFLNVNPATPVPAGFSSIVNEPSVVSVGDQILYTGNWYATTSDDGGASFTHLDPFTGPFVPPASGGFCCDQVTATSNDGETVFYMQQYLADATTGVQRINVDQGADGTFDCFYDISPTTLGFGANTWSDFPDLAASDGFLYHSTNVFNTTTFAFEGAVVARYSETGLATCGSVPFDTYMDTSFFSFKLTRGATSEMYFADHISTAAMRIWRWPDSAMTPTSFDRAVSALDEQHAGVPRTGRPGLVRLHRSPAGGRLSRGRRRRLHVGPRRRTPPSPSRTREWHSSTPRPSLSWVSPSSGAVAWRSSTRPLRPTASRTSAAA